MNEDQVVPIFILLFIAVAIWNILAFSYLFYKRRKRGSLFPEVATDDIIFTERTASGCSHKSMFTKFGGATNCLKIVITNNELWTTSWLPFSLFIEKLDMEHRIRKDRILSIEKQKTLSGTSFIIHFETDNHSEKTIQLYPKNPIAFSRAMASE
jgi:hypothetical protein